MEKKNETSREEITSECLTQHFPELNGAILSMIESEGDFRFINIVGQKNGQRVGLECFVYTRAWVGLNVWLGDDVVARLKVSCGEYGMSWQEARAKFNKIAGI